MLTLINILMNNCPIVSAINDIHSELSTNIRLFSSGKSSIRVGRSENLDRLMSAESTANVPANVTRSLTFSDKLLYIYTSGTTGLPKAAVIKNSRSETFQFVTSVNITPVSFIDFTSTVVGFII